MSEQVLTEAMRCEIDKALTKFPADRKRSAALLTIHIVQDLGAGGVSQEQLDAIADYLGESRVAIYEVATFYTMCKRDPTGRYNISVCTNLPCQLCGVDKIVEHLQKRLKINFGETTADGKFSLEEAECLGACVNAPMCQIGKKYYENLTPEKIDQLLAELEAETKN